MLNNFSDSRQISRFTQLEEAHPVGAWLDGPELIHVDQHLLGVELFRLLLLFCDFLGVAVDFVQALN